MDNKRALRLSSWLWGGVVVVLVLLALSFVPSSYVVQRPGPVFDTLGHANTRDGTEIPLISISGTETYDDTAGALSLTTVRVVGNPDKPLSWMDVGLAWFNPAMEIVPMEAIFPPGETVTERDERNAALMDESQNEATAAALRELGFAVPAEVEVVDIGPGSAAEGLLKAGDRLLALNGIALTSTGDLRARVQQSAGQPVTLSLLRSGTPHDIAVTPTRADAGSPWLIGAYVLTHYDFPIEVVIQLDNVGGPSAGLMFALGIVDRLTPGPLTGGAAIAGTGTIDSEGRVGAIGGIQQKLHGARDAGSTFFFAPESNCAHISRVPSGLQVVRVATLSEALAALDVIAAGGETDALPSCTTAPSG